MIGTLLILLGSSMLRECFRVLKSNGTIRISTPDLRFLIELYNHPQNDYIRYMIDFTPWAPTVDRTSSSTTSSEIGGMNSFMTNQR